MYPKPYSIYLKGIIPSSGKTRRGMILRKNWAASDIVKRITGWGYRIARDVFLGEGSFNGLRKGFPGANIFVELCPQNQAPQKSQRLRALNSAIVAS